MFLAYKMSHPNRQQCDYNNPPAPGKVCEFSLDSFGPCSSENLYGFHRKTPCVILKLRKNPSWDPEFYNSTYLPSDMPQDLREHIQKSGKNQVC